MASEKSGGDVTPAARSALRAGGAARAILARRRATA